MTACQHTQTVPCTTPAAYRLTFRSGHGLETIVATCRGHADPRTNQEREAGGSLVAVEELPPPPAPIQPTPVGLDAIDVRPATPAGEPFAADLAVHPGAIVDQEIADRGWTVERAATELCWSNGLLRAMIAGRETIKPSLAADLARVFGLTAESWLRLQERSTRHSAQQAAATDVGAG